MADTRIYSLAKQLHLESKDILELCLQVGLKEKTSTLSALNEQEEKLVRDAAASRVKSAKSDGTSAPERPKLAATGKTPIGKMRVLAPSGKAGKGEIAGDISSDISSELSDSDDESESEETSPEKISAPKKKTKATSGNTSKNSGVIPPETSSTSVPAESVAPSKPRISLAPIPKIKQVAKPATPLSPKPIAKVPPVANQPTSSSGATSPGATKKASPLGGFINKKKDVSEETATSGMQSDSPISEHGSISAEPVSTGLSDRDYMAAMQRKGYRGPMRVITDRIPSFDPKSVTSGGELIDGESKSRERGSSKQTLHVAPLPRGAKPQKTQTPAGPSPQKPDLKLSLSAIRAVKDGTSTADQQIQKTEQSRAAAVAAANDKKKPRRLVTAEQEAEELAAKQLLARRGQKDAPAPEQKKRRRSSTGRRNQDDEHEIQPPKQLRRLKNKGNRSTAAPRKGDIVLQLPCTVKQFAEMTGLSLAMVMKKLIELGIPKVLTSTLDDEAAHFLVEAFKLNVEVRGEVTLEDQIVASLFEDDDPDSPDLVSRPPVVTFLGHVDHGKTSLLDKILKINVVSGEKGGITQHIRAYRVATPKGDVAFVDTPGHEAFTEMRARGANCTDIAVVVVAADDGVMPQTEEAISHARAAGVPIVVALNKIDLPGINLDRVMQELATNDLLPSEWGGDVEVVKCSALTGAGMDQLLDMLLTIAELHDIKANPSRPAIGVALEAEMQSGQGVVAKVLVQNGTLRTGDIILCGTAYGRVRAMYDTLDANKLIEAATPGTPVQLVGLDMAPSAGSRFCVVEDISAARRVAEVRAKESRKTELHDSRPRITLENLFQRIDGSVSMLNIIIRADVRGSIEAIKKELGKLDHPEVQIRILQATVGGITEADVQLADASEAIIVGFNVVPDEKARSLADSRKIQIRRYDIIYKLTDDIRAALEGMLKPLSQVKELGRALVQRVFSISRLGNIAGCRVLAGTIERDGRARVIRESRIIGEYTLDSLKREKDDAKEVREGYECGIKLKGFNDLKEGDVLEVYKIEEVARTF